MARAHTKTAERRIIGHSSARESLGVDGIEQQLERVARLSAEERAKTNQHDAPLPDSGFEDGGLAAEGFPLAERPATEQQVVLGISRDDRYWRTWCDLEGAAADEERDTFCRHSIRERVFRIERDAKQRPRNEELAGGDVLDDISHRQFEEIDGKSRGRVDRDQASTRFDEPSNALRACGADAARVRWRHGARRMPIEDDVWLLFGEDQHVMARQITRPYVGVVQRVVGKFVTLQHPPRPALTDVRDPAPFPVFYDPVADPGLVQRHIGRPDQLRGYTRGGLESEELHTELSRQLFDAVARYPANNESARIPGRASNRERCGGPSYFAHRH